MEWLVCARFRPCPGDETAKGCASHSVIFPHDAVMLVLVLLGTAPWS